jgi:short-subunit dehydrogenase
MMMQTKPNLFVLGPIANAGLLYSIATRPDNNYNLLLLIDKSANNKSSLQQLFQQQQSAKNSPPLLKRIIEIDITAANATSQLIQSIVTEFLPNYQLHLIIEQLNNHWGLFPLIPEDYQKRFNTNLLLIINLIQGFTRALINNSQYLQRSHIIGLNSTLVNTFASYSGLTLNNISGSALKGALYSITDDLRSLNIKPTNLLLGPVNNPNAKHNSQYNLAAAELTAEKGKILKNWADLGAHELIQLRDITETIDFIVASADTVIPRDITLQPCKQPISMTRAAEKLVLGKGGVPALKSIIPSAYGDWIFLTGASEGLGRKIATTLAAEGFSLVLLARKLQNLQETVRQCERVKVRENQRFEAFPCDVGNLTELQLIAQKSVELFGTSHCRALVGNAGINRRKSIIASDFNVFKDIIDVNYTSNVLLTHHFAPIFAHNRAGHLIYVNSLAAYSSMNSAPGASPYFSSKSALFSFANCIYDDLRDYGVKVSSILPGTINNSLGTKKGPFAAPDSEQLLQLEDISRWISFVLRSSSTVCPLSVALHTRPTVYQQQYQQLTKPLFNVEAADNTLLLAKL